MEHDLLELCRLLLERHLEVRLVEEARIAQPRGEHLAVALDDLRAAIDRLDIGGADERVRQLARLVAADEIFLVHPRGELDHLGRDVEERGVETAEERHRPFGEAGIFRDQTFVLDQLEAGFGGEIRGALPDDARALVLVDDDVAGTQLFDIIGGRADRDRAGMVEAVTDRRGAAGDAGDLERNDIAAEQGDDPLQRPHPAKTLGRRGCVSPAHRFGPGEGAHDGRDRLGQHRGGRAAGFLDHGEEDSVALDELVARQPRLAQEPLQRLRRRGRARPFQLLAHRLGLGRQAARDQREPARSRIGLHGLRGEPGSRELFPEEARKIPPRLRLHPRRNFLRKELEEEIAHRRSSPGRGRFWSILTPPIRSCPSRPGSCPSRDRGRGRYRPGARRPR